MRKIKIVLVILALFALYQVSFTQQISLKQLTYSDSTHDGYPYWSADGENIIFSSGTSSTCNAMMISVNGGETELLTDSFAQHALWSPDGNYIAFDGDFGTTIKLISTNGGSPVRIDPDTLKIINSGMPCWSPDSRSIAFVSMGIIYTLNIETGECLEIFRKEGKVSIPFDWDPDGSHILADVRDTINRGETDIWIFPAQGGKGKQLTHLKGRQVKPDFSPDGSMLLFTSDHGGNTDLWIMSSDGGETVQITFYKGDDSNPGFDIEGSWSPDGKKITFSSTRSGYWAIWLLEPDIEFIKEKLNIK